METSNMVDYVRLATWDDNAYAALCSMASQLTGTAPKPKKWLQYKGSQFDKVFVGKAEQRGKVHTILQCSGDYCNKLLAYDERIATMYCTRIDLQRTVLRPSWHVLRKVRDDVSLKNTTLIESKDNDTLYLYSRESELFVRLYEKPLETVYLRLEYELKGARARTAFNYWVGGESFERIFAKYLEVTPLPDTSKELFKIEGVDATVLLLKQEYDKNIKTKLNWLVNLDATVKRLAVDPDIGAEVHLLLRTWYEYSQRHAHDLGI